MQNVFYGGIIVEVSYPRFPSAYILKSYMADPSEMYTQWSLGIKT